MNGRVVAALVLSAFYGSDSRRRGPREAILSRIESYLDTILWLSDESIDDLRVSNNSVSG
jgi:hypothetical protein